MQLHEHRQQRSEEVVSNGLNTDLSAFGEGKLTNTSHRRSNLSLNQGDDPVILPNPNHHGSKLHQSYSRSQENGFIADVHNQRNDDESNINSKHTDSIRHGNFQTGNLHFKLNEQSNRIGDTFHPGVEKRISSSSSGGYSATDEVDYLKWVSETKGQLKQHLGNKTVLSINAQGKQKRVREKAASKSINSSSSGVSSAESGPADTLDLTSKASNPNKQCSTTPNQKRSPSINSSSSGHGSPGDSVIGGNVSNYDSNCPGNPKDCDIPSAVVARNCEDQVQLPIKSNSQYRDGDNSPVSSSTRLNSSSPDSGYEHISSSGNFLPFLIAINFKLLMRYRMN